MLISSAVKWSGPNDAPTRLIKSWTTFYFCCVVKSYKKHSLFALSADYSLTFISHIFSVINACHVVCSCQQGPCLTSHINVTDFNATFQPVDTPLRSPMTLHCREVCIKYMLLQVMKTYHMYHTESLSAESKLKDAEKQEEKHIGKANDISSGLLRYGHDERPQRRSSVKKMEKLKEKVRLGGLVHSRLMGCITDIVSTHNLLMHP